MKLAGIIIELALAVFAATFTLVSIGLAVWLALTPAHASERSDWFQSLKQPTNGVTCCDVSDCHKTEADWKGGHWNAKVLGVWRVIPDSVIVRNPPSIDGEAYVCSSNDTLHPEKATIYCFVPPSPGS